MGAEDLGAVRLRDIYGIRVLACNVNIGKVWWKLFINKRLVVFVSSCSES